VAITKELLNNIAQTLRIARTDSGQLQPGAPVTVKLEPDISNLSVTDIVNGTFNLVWITKDVIFKDASLEGALDETSLTSNAGQPDNPDNKILRGLPISNPASSLNQTLTGTLNAPLTGALNGPLGQLTGPINGALGGTLTGTLTGAAGELIGTVANAPGLLGQLKGTIPIGPIQLPVGVQITWWVTDDSSPPNTLIEGQDYFATDGLNALVTTLVLLPGIARMSTMHPVPPPVRRIVHARITLQAGGITSDPIELRLPLLVPSIAIPTLLVLFRHPNFAPLANDGKDQGVALIIVPPDSPLANFSAIVNTLNALRSTIATLSLLNSPALSLAGFLLGLDVLIQVLSAPQPIVLMDTRLEIANLEDIKIDRGIFTVPIVDLDILALTAEDRFDSLIFIGKPGDKAQLSTNRNFVSSGGQFTITVRQELFVIMRDLRSALPSHEPVHNPDNIFTRNSAPDGRLSPRTRDPLDPLHTVTTFGHEISSIRITLAP
jgi:hypothetical protein